MGRLADSNQRLSPHPPKSDDRLLALPRVADPRGCALTFDRKHFRISRGGNHRSTNLCRNAVYLPQLRVTRVGRKGEECGEKCQQLDKADAHHARFQKLSGRWKSVLTFDAGAAWPSSAR